MRDVGRTAPQTSEVAPAWDAELGALLIVPSDTDNAGIVLFPDDSVTPDSARVTLVNAGGDTTSAVLARTDSVQCGDAPVVHLSAANPVAWSVGMSARSARIIRTDSIEVLPPADSARLAADLARLASALPMAKGSRFTGLPFGVASAHRFESAGRQYVVAELTRRLNQEAAPLEERTFLVGERPASAKERFVVTFSQRSEGTEDTAEHFDLLSALLGSRSLLLLVARDQLSQTQYELLERQGGGTWRVSWSRTLHC